MSRWFRFYDEALNDPKILKLPDSLFRIWVGILCVASKNGGALPPIDDLALLLRIKKDKMHVAMESLIKSGLIDDNRPHNWDRRQYKSDVSTERVKRFRNGHVTLLKRPQSTDNRTEQITENKDTADAVSPYAFESGVIRLKQSDFDKWTRAYRNLNLSAELLSLTEWAGQQPKWFFAVSAALAKRDREVMAKKETAKSFKWASGIEGVY